MHPNGPVALRFPLVARPRPACVALSARVEELCARAQAAERDGDRAGASAVYNQAALIASDCGLPDLARRWCHRHASAYLRALPEGAQVARYALEPLVNLARLHIRDGDGDAAFDLLDTLYEAVVARTDVVIDGIVVSMARLIDHGDHHQQVRQWLWSVHLADGTRALTTAGRWQQAHDHLRHRNGIGQRMLDGRQVAVIAHATAGDSASALDLLRHTAPGEAWEDAVTACLAVLSDPEPTMQSRTTMLDRYQQLTYGTGLAVFHTRLGLSVIDAASGVNCERSRDIAAALIRRIAASPDGYAAREVLAHAGCDAFLRGDQRSQLHDMINTSGLGRRIPSTEVETMLSAALATCEGIIALALEGGAVDLAVHPSN